MNKEKYGVHIAHCCYIHGCKYGDRDCPVVSGKVAQKYPCYDCNEEAEPYTLEEIELLRKTKSYRPTHKEMQQQIADLETELAEKDKEIAYLKEIRILKDNSNMTTKINGVDFSDEQILTLQVLDILKRYNQKELAIQELEKVKEKICCEMAIREYDIGEQTADVCVSIAEQIDQQIKELKGEKNDN